MKEDVATCPEENVKEGSVPITRHVQTTEEAELSAHDCGPAKVPAFIATEGVPPSAAAPTLIPAPAVKDST